MSAYRCQAITRTGRACRCPGAFCIGSEGGELIICKRHYVELGRYPGPGLPFRVGRARSAEPGITQSEKTP